MSISVLSNKLFVSHQIRYNPPSNSNVRLSYSCTENIFAFLSAPKCDVLKSTKVSE
jgi:hypothetical protein